MLTSLVKSEVRKDGWLLTLQGVRLSLSADEVYELLGVLGDKYFEYAIVKDIEINDEVQELCRES
jgi:hypothetical protein